jgi:hypothetical protein
VGRRRNQAHIAMALAASGVIATNHQQAGVLALRARIGLQRHAPKTGDRRQHMLQLAEHGLVALGLAIGANGCSRAHLGQLIGTISAVPFSFMVHEPSGIMEWVSDRSRASSRRM